MKKLLVLALVLSVATMANAGLVLTGAPASVETGGSATVGVYSDASIAYQDGLYYVVAIETALANVDYLTGVAVCTDSGMSIMHDGGAVSMGFTIPEGFDGVGGGAFNMDAPTGLAAQQLFSGFAVSFGQIAGVANLTIFTSPDGGVWTAAATAPITISGPTVPEPMTLGLLALGGLFLRRK